MGRLLGAMGCDVMTGAIRSDGGGQQGRPSGGAHVIGVTMGRFADRVNRFV